MILASRDGIVWETSSGRNQQVQPSCRSSKTLRTLAPLSTGERARFEKILPLLVPGRFAFLWRNGNFVSTMCTQPTFPGRCLSAFKPCSWTTTLNTTGTKAVVCLGKAPLCSMGWCTVASVDTSWSCNTRGERAISATRLASEISCARLPTYSRGCRRPFHRRSVLPGTLPH